MVKLEVMNRNVRTYRFLWCLLGGKNDILVIINIWLNERRSCCLELAKYNRGRRMSFTGLRFFFLKK